MKTLRTIKGVNLRDQIRSKLIREDLEIQDIVEFTRVRRRFWRDHVDRMTEGRSAKFVHFAILDEKRNSRRPSTDFSRDGARAGHLFKRLNNIKKSRRYKTKSSEKGKKTKCQ
ncbi:hypothetical protein Trydic_g11284 [Trypoxylus dichotomus]